MFDDLFDELEKSMIPELEDDFDDFEEGACEDLLGLGDLDDLRFAAEGIGLDPEDYSTTSDLVQAMLAELTWNEELENGDEDQFDEDIFEDDLDI